MGGRQWVVLIGLLVGTHAHAASFDCKQARSAIEKLICSNAELSALDSQLGTSYATAKRYASTASAKQVIDAQLPWLRDVRNKCSDAACLSKVYKARINELDPLADQSITCEEMRQSPEWIFSAGIDLGSGFGSPTEVDYGCPESLRQLQFMQPLLRLAEQIRGDQGPQVCSGSIVHFQRRAYWFSLLAAGLSPRTLLPSAVPARADMNWRAILDTDATDDSTKVAFYLRQWSEQSPFNINLYSQFTREFDRVWPQLAQHYVQKFGLTQSDAQVAARGALLFLVDRAGGGFPRDTLLRETALMRLVRNQNTEPEAILREVKNAKDDPGLYPADELYRVLTIALINNRPPQIVAALADTVDLGAVRVEEGYEPLLSYALRNQGNLELLLSKKAPVNQANGFGKTALFHAVEASNYPAVDTLLRTGADVNRTYKSAKELRPDDNECTYFGLRHTRRTPLMHAAQNSDVQMLKVLVQEGALVTAADDLGYNALDYAAMGGKKENETYLKSLGLELGAPEYTTEADPSVREQRIQASLSFQGNVNKLRVAAGRPDLLLASVLPSGKPSAAANYGLYLISITDPNQPRVISSFTAAYVNDFAVSPDGKRAYMMETANNDDASPSRKYGLSILDIARPEKPTRIAQIEGDFIAMELSPDGKLIYLQERELKKNFSRGLLVFGIEPNGATLKCANPFGKAEEYGRTVFAYSFTSFPDEPLLLIHDQSSRLLLFDVKDPCAPREVLNISSELGIRAIAEPRRTILSGSGGELQRLRLGDPPVRVAGYLASVSAFDTSVKTGTTAAVIRKDVAIFRTSPSGRLKLTDRFRPEPYVGSVLLTGDGRVYIGWQGGLGVGVVPKN